MAPTILRLLLALALKPATLLLGSDNFAEASLLDLLGVQADSGPVSLLWVAIGSYHRSDYQMTLDLSMYHLWCSAFAIRGTDLAYYVNLGSALSDQAEKHLGLVVCVL